MACVHRRYLTHKTVPFCPTAAALQIYYSNESGFEISMADQIAYNTWFAELVSSWTACFPPCNRYVSRSTENGALP